MKIDGLWLACDCAGDEKPLEIAIEKLRRAGIKQRSLRVYVLIGKDMAREEDRLKWIYRLGAMPYAQLYKDGNGKPEYDNKWKSFMRTWSLPVFRGNLAKICGAPVGHTVAA